MSDREDNSPRFSDGDRPPAPPGSMVSPSTKGSPSVTEALMKKPSPGPGSGGGRFARRMSLKERGDFFASNAPSVPQQSPPLIHSDSIQSVDEAPPKVLATGGSVATIGVDNHVMAGMMPTRLEYPPISSMPTGLSSKAIYLRTASNDVGDFGDVYVPPSTANLKYLPVDMLTSPNVKNSIARGILQNALVKGINVIKHGEQLC